MPNRAKRIVPTIGNQPKLMMLLIKAWRRSRTKVKLRQFDKDKSGCLWLIQRIRLLALLKMRIKIWTKIAKTIKARGRQEINRRRKPKVKNPKLKASLRKASPRQLTRAQQKAKPKRVPKRKTYKQASWSEIKWTTTIWPTNHKKKFKKLKIARNPTSNQVVNNDSGSWNSSLNKLLIILNTI